MTKEDSVLNQIVSDDYFYKITRIMYGTNIYLTKLCLWGLSNLTGVERYAQKFLQDERCLIRCLFFMTNQCVSLSSEASFVVTFALLNVRNETLRSVWSCSGSDIGEALTNCLLRIEKNSNETLVLQILKTLH